MNTPLMFKVNDSLVYELRQNEFLKLDFIGVEKYVDICHGENFEECFTLKLNPKYPRYFSCSIPTKHQFSIIKEMKTNEGKLSPRQIECLQGLSNAEEPDLVDKF